jgi:hypothetical protein
MNRYTGRLKGVFAMQRESDRRDYESASKKRRPSDVPKFDEFEEKSFAEPQPLRTDLESILGARGFIDVDIEG